MSINENTFPEIEVFEEKKLSSKKTELFPTDLKAKNYYEENAVKYFSHKELIKFFKMQEDAFLSLVFRLLYETGARVSEALELSFSDLDFASNKVKVVTNKQRGRKVYRFLYLSDDLKARIVKYQLDKSFDSSSPILSKNGVKAISRQTVFNYMKKAVLNSLGKAYLDKAHPHVLRHSRAIHLLDSGMNLMLLKKFLGHRNIANTLIYLQYSNQELKNSLMQANEKIMI